MSRSSIIQDLANQQLLANEKEAPAHYYLPSFLEVELGVLIYCVLNKPLPSPVDVIHAEDDQVILTESQMDALHLLLSAAGRTNWWPWRW